MIYMYTLLQSQLQLKIAIFDDPTKFLFPFLLSSCPNNKLSQVEILWLVVVGAIIQSNL